MLVRLIKYDLLKEIIDKDLEAWTRCLAAVDITNAANVTYDEYSRLQKAVNESTASVIIDHIGVSIGHPIDDHWCENIVDVLNRAQGNPDEYYYEIHDTILNIYRRVVDDEITKLKELVKEYNYLLGSLPVKDDNQ